MGAAVFAMSVVLLLASIAGYADAVSVDRPEPNQNVTFARWLVCQNTWGVISTKSVHLRGIPYGNVVSFSDGVVKHGSGQPYFFLTPLDYTAIDADAEPFASLTLSEMSLGTCRHTDPEWPTCAKITISGSLIPVNTNHTDEIAFAHAAIFSKHPQFDQLPADHHFQYYKLKMQNISMLNIFGGPKDIDIAEYLAAPAC